MTQKTRNYYGYMILRATFRHMIDSNDSDEALRCVGERYLALDPAPCPVPILTCSSVAWAIKQQVIGKVQS